MTLPEPSPTTVSPGFPNTANAQEDVFKFNPVQMIEAFEEEINQFLKETKENIIKQMKEMDKTV